MADETMTPDNPDTVWANTWNPPTDEWSPSAEPHNTWGVAQPGHGDLSMANPMVDAPGDPRTVPPTTGGSAPDVRDNLLTDVKKSMAVAPPPQVVHHVVENVERGAESVNVRQITVVGNQAPTQLLESNPARRRALIRIVPNNPGGVNSENNNLTAVGVPATVTVPAGQIWTIQNIAYLFTASAVVANRTPRLTIKDAGGRTIFQWVSPTNVAASQVEQVNLAPGLPNTTGGAGTVPNPFVVSGGIPPLVLTAGETITADAIAEDAGDSITVGTVMFALSGGGSIFIAARQQPGSAAASATWFKLLLGDPPLEVKSQDGIDGIGALSTDSIAVQVYEELVGARPDTPGIGL